MWMRMVMATQENGKIYILSFRNSETDDWEGFGMRMFENGDSSFGFRKDGVFNGVGTLI